MTASENGQTPADPFELWRKIYEANEKAWNAVLSRAVASPSYAESQGKLLETILAGQQAVRDGMRTYLETVNVPTREDIARLGELIVGLEEKVDQLDDRLQDLAADIARQRAAAASVDSTAPPAEPARPTSGTASAERVPSESQAPAPRVRTAAGSGASRPRRSPRKAA